MRSIKTTTHLLTAALTLAAVTATASAVQPQRWTHRTEADFNDGEVRDTVVTNLGDIMLATGSDIIGEMPEQASITYDLQRVGDTIYVAAGPEAKLMRFNADGEFDEVIALPNEQVFTLDRIDGELLVAVSGASSRLATLDADGELVTLVELPDVQYIWDTVVRDDAIYLATGTEGQVLRVAREGGGTFSEPTVVLDANQTNVLTLAADANGRLYAGTDTDGLIYRLTPRNGDEWEAFVLYDAPEPEVAALLVLDDGTVFAGTADAEQARPGRLEDAAADPAGRPDVPAGPEPAPPAEDDMPEPEDIPAVPPEADPIEDPDGDGVEAPGEPEPQNGDEAIDDVDGVVDDPEPDPMRAMIRRWQAGPLAASPSTSRLDTNNAPDAPETPADSDAPAAAPEVTPDATPTAEQRDRMREQVRGQLRDARDTGTLQAGVRAAPRQQARRAPTSQRARPAEARRATQAGNAIYRIDPQGFVNEVFRESVMIFKIVEAGDRLLVATGNEGQLYSVNPRTEETTIIADLTPEQITSILVTDDGELLLGTANAAQLVRLDDTMANRGTYTSKVLDATQISLFGTLRLTADIPEGTSVLVETRSGNVGDPDQAPWAQWTEAQTFRHNADASSLQPREVKVDAPPARFLQYRLTLLGNRDATPVISQIETAYVMPNLPPRVRSVRAQYPGAARGRGGSGDNPPSTRMNIEWDASDPNEDELVYKVEYQPAGSSRYILIADDVRETSYEWETRRVPDGRYVIRVTASDRPSNPPDMAKTTTRRSDAVLVDNTPPTLDELDVALEGGDVKVSGLAVDALSPIQSIAYAVNNTDEYTPVLPDDLIFDSTRERFSVTIPNLDSGQHVVTLRVRDARGNTRHEAVMVDVD
ncbi:hypothetical protein ACERK3_06625 [Phycisphaerales bacterium AB-hyl4]|uniref:Fibronectin type-III domain-containing protein n=1 Tax=Natronomicrosphaera hydrolytica TaxID=3242702 RepID=A0ABV4U5F1_9BACT